MVEHPCDLPPSLSGRYRHLRDDPHALRNLRIRSRVTAALRRALHQRSFVEIDTPILGRAAAGSTPPFPVGAATLDGNLHLNGDPLYLRGMLTTGMSRVFEIGRTFRDEPPDATHEPEYTLLEAYQTGADYQRMLDLAKCLLLTATNAASRTTSITTPAGQLISIAAPWQAQSFYPALSAAVGSAVTPASRSARLKSIAADRGILLTSGQAQDQAVELFDQLAQPMITGLAVVKDFPAGPSPMARPCGHDPRLAQKWDLIIAGHEIATGYTEQHEQPSAATSASGAAETRVLDASWREVFAGMYPAGGLCIGLDRLIMLLTGTPAVQDVIAFPLGNPAT